MKYKISVSDETQLDIREGSEYYSKISEALNQKFLSEIINTIEIIQVNPLHHQIRYKKIRIAFTEIFPYGIHFIISNETIYIFRVLHTKRFYK